MSRRVQSRRSKGGFTLIELIVVMAVLTVLAGLILPKLDVFKLKANKAAAASNIHGVDRFIQSYKVQKDLFPDNWDSLLDTTGAALFTAQLDPQLIGGPPAGSPTKLTIDTIDDVDQLRSLTRVGITTVLDHTTGHFPADSATDERALDIGDSFATINAADGDGAAIIEHLYPGSGGVPAGKKIFVVGLGPRNQMMGDTLHVAPFYANTDQVSYYSRFLVAFELDTGGSRAKLLGSLGADADTISEEIIDFYEN